MRNSIIARYKKIPTGTIIPFAGSKEIYEENLSNWFLICDGSSYSIEDYEDLYSVIGTIWGGTGTPEFNVPNLLGRFLRGADLGAGVDPDAETRKSIEGNVVGPVVGGYQNDVFKQHTHQSQNAHQKNGNPDGAQDDGPNNVIGRERSYWRNGTIFSETSNEGGKETRPVNAAVLFLIKT
ncbi:phage tail protein [uncultured Tenacibaculum sp.]|uniref:phage tail protein n=1 Tax=uncultured Tenacibaculum sp. TaxID=174713 RepID=UPI00261CD6F5|nr:phage tail protein [uncultured Tenacibaculum sp.]